MKEIAVCLQHRFYQYEGGLYTKLSFPYAYWLDYLTYFDKVTIIARVEKVENLEGGMAAVSGPRVVFEALPYYVGPKEFLGVLLPLLSRLCTLAKKYNHFLLRSGTVSDILFFFLVLLKKPFLREYPGNIKEGVAGFLDSKGLSVRVVANVMHYFAKFQARFSQANGFVSSYCKDLYSSSKPSYVFSSFRSDEITCQKTDYGLCGDLNIVSVGRLEGEKGHVNLIEAISGLTNCELSLVGDGSKRNELQAIADKNTIRVRFYGNVVDRDALFSIVRSADIYVIPSLTEGMPRSLLEAMAMGMPCIGANVGGIPEVLPAEYLYNANNAVELREKISRLQKNKDLRIKSGIRNKKYIDNNYSVTAVQAKKHAFWERLYE